MPLVSPYSPATWPQGHAPSCCANCSTWCSFRVDGAVQRAAVPPGGPRGHICHGAPGHHRAGARRGGRRALRAAAPRRGRAAVRLWAPRALIHRAAAGGEAGARRGGAAGRLWALRGRWNGDCRRSVRRAARRSAGLVLGATRASDLRRPAARLARAASEWQTGVGRRVGLVVAATCGGRLRAAVAKGNSGGRAG